MRFKRHLQIYKGRVDLTPLIDVVFQLLIFFMLSSSYVMQPGILVDLPESRLVAPARSENLVVTAQSGDRSISIEGTVFTDNLPRVLAIDGYRMDMVPEGHMIIIRNDDQPGVIGLVGTLMGNNDVNIADMTVSRRDKTALIVLKIDAPPPQTVLDELLARTPPIQRVRTVSLPPLERNQH